MTKKNWFDTWRDKLVGKVVDRFLPTYLPLTEEGNTFLINELGKHCRSDFGAYRLEALPTQDQVGNYFPNACLVVSCMEFELKQLLKKPLYRKNLVEKKPKISELLRYKTVIGSARFPFTGFLGTYRLLSNRDHLDDLDKWYAILLDKWEKAYDPTTDSFQKLGNESAFLKKVQEVYPTMKKHGNRVGWTVDGFFYLSLLPTTVSFLNGLQSRTLHGLFMTSSGIGFTLSYLLFVAFVCCTFSTSLDIFVEYYAKKRKNQLLKMVEKSLKLDQSIL